MGLICEESGLLRAESQVADQVSMLLQKRVKDVYQTTSSLPFNSSNSQGYGFLTGLYLRLFSTWC